MSKPIDQEREALTSEVLGRYLRDLHLRTFPDNDEGDYDLRWTAGEIKRVEKAIAASRASVQPAGVAVPEGWKLVPIEPTDKMTWVSPLESSPETLRHLWEAMLAAAPHPVSGEQKPEPRPSWLDGGAEAVAMAKEDEANAELCDHQWTDDGMHLLVCTVCGAQENHDPQWRDMSTAPRDGTMLRLLVEFTEHSTEDAEQAPTIGANNFANDGEDRWLFAGWCWSHDHFTQGEGEPIGWLPMLNDPVCTPGNGGAGEVE